MSAPQYLGRLTIANGAAVSDEFSRDVFRSCRSICLVSNDAALTNVVSLQAYPMDDTATTPRTVQSPPGTDITLAAAKAVVLTALPFARIRLQSAGNEGGTRTWDVWGEVGE